MIWLDNFFFGGRMKHSMRHLCLVVLVISTVACGGGGSGGGSQAGPSTTEPTYDIQALGIPRFVGRQHIPLASIAQISRFRSSVGHSYTDPSESCRSMKHYFAQRGSTPQTLIVSSPVDGTVRQLTPESNGDALQLHIQATNQPAFRIILFHATPSVSLAVGTPVSAGQPIATTTAFLSDVAVSVNTPQGSRYVSWFDVMAEALFQEYRAVGVGARDDMIISRAARDADPLTCNGESFLTAGTLPNWVLLQ